MMPERRDDYVFSEQDRIEFDRWLQLLPSGSPYEAIFHLVRLQVKHDTAGVRMTMRGYEQFLIEADQVLGALAPLPAIITGVRADVDRLTAETADLKTNIVERRKALDARVHALETRPPAAPRWVPSMLLLFALVDAIQFVLLALLLWRLF